jgi:hypothetical protein
LLISEEIVNRSHLEDRKIVRGQASGPASSPEGKMKILTTPEKYAPHFTGQAGIQGVFRGLKFESDSGIEQKRTLFKGLKRRKGT